jgi:hypothetical protein
VPTVYVTPEDVAAGVRRSNARCPVARAVHRQFGRDKAVLYDRLPEVARHFIGRFDAGLDVGPFTFDVGAADVVTPGPESPAER